MVPTYEYQCERCKRVFEIWQRISDPPLTKCETCGRPIRRLLAPAAFILKGAGFYVNDYPSETRKKAQEAEKKSDQEPRPASESSAPAATPTPEGS